MTHQLRSRDIIALGFMTFALFVGAGNIIFPPMVGLQAGEHVWTAAFGFLITAVGLPVLIGSHIHRQNRFFRFLRSRRSSRAEG